LGAELRGFACLAIDRRFVVVSMGSTETPNPFINRFSGCECPFAQKPFEQQ
jgi:hypothetical protein